MKKLSFILLAATLTLSVLTGCGGNKEPAADTKAKVESTAEEKPEAGTDNNGVAWNLTKEEADEYPEGTVFLAPPLDADGNYPEDFDPESYDGAAEQEFQKEDLKADTKKTDSKETTDKSN